MAKNKFNIGKLLGLKSRDIKSRQATRVFTLDDLEQGESILTGFDPGKGRSTYREKITVRFGFSGHIIEGPAEYILGECVICRERFKKAGQPENITVVPRDEGGGGLCHGCGKVFCFGCARVDEEGNWWCGSCELRRRKEIVKGAAFKFLKKAFGEENDG